MDKWDRDAAEKDYEQQWDRIKPSMRPLDYTDGSSVWGNERSLANQIHGFGSWKMSIYWNLEVS